MARDHSFLGNIHPSGWMGISVLFILVNSTSAYTPFVYGQNTAPGMDKWFKDAKLGMFMHWGPVSQWGTEISFPLVCKEFPCTVRGPNNVDMVINTTEQLSAHRQAYAALANTFDPVDFDAAAMAKLAKAAGFKYLMYTTVHCDGFLNWPSNLSAYNIANTPWGKKGRGTFSELVTAFRAEGLKVGAYICPSLWNNDNYWQPNALNATGPVCAPNYLPASDPVRWAKFNGFLHGIVQELTALYAPDAFWFDCSNSPPTTDTHLEAVLRDIRSANPDAVVNIRGGMWSDYHETRDQSEQFANLILDVQQETAGNYFEIPAVLQASHQWAFDPKSLQKPAAEVLANLVLLTAKGGNYLMNVAPGPNGVWAPTAVSVLQTLAKWFSANGEALTNTRPIWPFQRENVFVTASTVTQAMYVIVPSIVPDASLNHDHTSVPTGSPLGKHNRSRAVFSEAFQKLQWDDEASLTLPWIRPSLLNGTLRKIELLSAPETTVQFTINDTVGVVISNAGLPPPAPMFNCSLFGCSCQKEAVYYNIDGGKDFGCAPPAAQAWWKTNDCEVLGPQPGPHPGCEGPTNLGVVFKFTVV
eukprot:m.252938 g.252938  ORF g.252938 m.252938 type:complete len:584 (+) comp19572_c0_seq2:48-1799(+)